MKDFRGARDGGLRGLARRGPGVKHEPHGLAGMRPGRELDNGRNGQAGEGLLLAFRPRSEPGQDIAASHGLLDQKIDIAADRAVGRKVGRKLARGDEDRTERAAELVRRRSGQRAHGRQAPLARQRDLRRRQRIRHATRLGGDAEGVHGEEHNAEPERRP